jgi:cellulose synthase/poly-beta-1,6-N-acetylglucosamine synthase-like glycosyltransferase
MNDLELPLGKRSKLYRLFEIIPALLSYGALLLLVILSIFNPLWASVYLLLVVITMFVKSLSINYNTLRGQHWLHTAQKVNWAERLLDLESPTTAYERINGTHSSAFGYAAHKENLRLLAIDNLARVYPKPSQIVNAVIIAAYNEDYDVIQPTIESVKATSYNNKQIVLYLAYEERGGAAIEATAQRLQREYADTFRTFQIVRHPKDMPDEVVGKGGNITYAGRQLQKWCDSNNVEYDDVIVTTLDSDNRPHTAYFDYVTYEYIIRSDRKQLSYQPIALYFGNIWDTSAPMRLIATGNSFWTIISSMRPRTLRNFAAHSQPLSALVEMDFWSTRSIVEDGHQYWRSYFFFHGNYSVIPIHVPIYQDAVMADTLKKTFIAQFKQLRRWGYGVSDIPYVAVRLFSRTRSVPFWGTLARFFRLIDSHVTLAVIAIMITLGGWVPLLLNSEASRNIAAHQLPIVVSRIQQVAMVGIIISIFLMLKLLPPRPARYKRRRTIGMVLQWLLMPVTTICYGSLASFSAQTHLMLGKYLDKFDVTDKATLASQEQARKNKPSKS